MTPSRVVRTRFRAAGLSCLVAGLLFGAGGRPLAGQAPEPKPPRRHVIEIRAFAYRPVTQAVAPGDTVVWVNRDLVPHTVTAKSGDWDSGAIEPGGAWRHVVRSAQETRYTCAYHPNMRASLRAELTDETEGARDESI